MLERIHTVIYISHDSHPFSKKKPHHSVELLTFSFGSKPKPDLGKRQTVIKLSRAQPSGATPCFNA